MRRLQLAAAVAVCVFSVNVTRSASAQSFGIELHNTLMPASGGMAGTSIARPQDPLSALNANPGTLTQFQGTQAMFAGGWAEPAFDLTQTGNVALPGITPFSAASGTPGSAVANLGITQSLDGYGLPATIGLGLITNAGAGVEFRGVPESNGTSSEILVLQFTGGVGIDLTENLSAGATISMGQSFFDGPFVGAGAMVPAYGLRGAVGLNYALTPATSLGMYYQSKENFVYEDAIRLELFNGALDVVRDVRMDLPDNVGLGVANSALMGGRLLLAADVLYKQWDNADLFQDIYHNQWVLQTGAQLSFEKCRLRIGYAYAENPIAPVTGTTVGGVPLQSVPAVNYLQAQLGIISPHRFAAGIGMPNIFPNVDMDMSAGTMFEDSEQFGEFTSIDLSSYWIALGLTWRFGGGCHCNRCGCSTPGGCDTCASCSSEPSS